MSAVSLIEAQRSPAQIIAAIREQLAVARAARDAALATENLAIMDGHWDIYDQALGLIFKALVEADDALLLLEVERMFAAIYGRA